jgi:hypothetical protein
MNSAKSPASLTSAPASSSPTFTSAVLPSLSLPLRFRRGLGRVDENFCDERSGEAIPEKLEIRPLVFGYHGLIQLDPVRMEMLGVVVWAKGAGGPLA